MGCWLKRGSFPSPSPHSGGEGVLRLREGENAIGGSGIQSRDRGRRVGWGEGGRARSQGRSLQGQCQRLEAQEGVLLPWNLPRRHCWVPAQPGPPQSPQAACVSLRLRQERPNVEAREGTAAHRAGGGEGGCGGPGGRGADAGASELAQCWASRLDHRRSSFVKAQA